MGIIRASRFRETSRRSQIQTQTQTRDSDLATTIQYSSHDDRRSAGAAAANDQTVLVTLVVERADRRPTKRRKALARERSPTDFGGLCACALQPRREPRRQGSKQPARIRGEGTPSKREDEGKVRDAHQGKGEAGEEEEVEV
jgi:hypothetical protein